MSCDACSEAQQQPSSAYYRWKNANLEMRGCDVHLREVFEALSGAQRAMTCIIPLGQPGHAKDCEHSRRSRKPTSKAELLAALEESHVRVERLRAALADIERGDYSDPLCQRTPEERARRALAEEDA